MQLTLRSVVVLQNYKELFKVCALMVDFKSLSRSHLEVVKSLTIYFILRLVVEFYSQCHKF